jgi:hypothetical protein
MATDPPPALSGFREARSVRFDRAFFWYSEAMRLFKRHPLGFAGLALVVFASDLALTLVPGFGATASRLVLPLIAASLLYASLATDRDDRPRVAHLAAPFAAPLPAIGTVLYASLAVSAVECLVAWQVAGINLLDTSEVRTLPPMMHLSIYIAGILVSLPLTLTPLLALFEGKGTKESFAVSTAAFFRNVPAFLLYGALSVALLGLAFVTMGLGLLIVLPLWAASSYAAWKDLFDIR